jgi:hypothetical protein
MLHIFLLILKFIGILILILLGILLLGLLLILMVPIRYRLTGSYCNKIKGIAKVSWLLHILSVTFFYEEDLTVIVRLFGFRIFRPKKAKKEEITEDEDFVLQTMEVKEADTKREEPRETKEFSKESKQKISSPKLEKESPKEEKKGSLRPSWKAKLTKKLKKILEKIKFLFRKIYDTLKKAKDKKEEMYTLLTNKDNQKTVKLFLKQAKKLIRHILPVKGKGNVTFGFEDPYLTGQVLTYVSAIYPFCHKHLNLYPVFDEAVFTAEGTFRGRVRCGKLLVIGIRMLMDKNFRVLLKKWLR